MRLRIIGVLAVALVAAMLASHVGPATATAPTGAIFTTVVDGSEVNFNIYPAKEAVYLDGGPGPGAPQDAAGLDDGVYVFMVTDPSGKKLLSTDNAECRQFTVSGGIIVDVQPSIDAGCAHNTGNDIDHPPAITVQLMPYDDTPNPGGEYKAWATKVGDYGCPLNKVDCQKRGYKHGFKPSDSKTDNFKVKSSISPEIDTQFFTDLNGNGELDANESFIDGDMVTWTDTNGASNHKWSYLNLSLDVHHEAHVESVELGTHQITIGDQPGCNVGLVHLDNVDQKVGPQTVSVYVDNIKVDRTYRILVACEP
jgi:hypothetical protein